MQEQAKTRIILIDDEEALRTAVRRILELEGFYVETAGNGTEGIALATTADFDLALIDMKMPDINGIEVLKEVRKARPNTICYIATAYASYETAIEATKLGADGYILKPFTPDELIQQLNKGVEKRRLLLETERLRKEREESLLEVAFERTRLKTIINSLRDGVIVINIRGESVYFNQAALSLLKIPYMPIGIPINEHLPQEIEAILNEQFFSTGKQENSFTIEINIDNKDEFFLEVTLSPVQQADGSLAGVVLVLKNITEFKKLEIAKSQFVSMVAHELKAPIAATIGFLDILVKPELKIEEAQKMDFLKRSHFRLDSLLLMINDLLDISRMELHKVVREVKELVVEDSVLEIFSLLKIDIEKKNLQATCETGGKRISIRVDQNEFQRLLLNLISNAVKYNRENGSVTVTISEDERSVIIEIADTGIGLKPEEQKKLFTEFYRAKNEKTKNIHGTGLGLSIVKRIIESYDGTIECRSTYGEGSRFTLFFPRIQNTENN